MRVRKFYIVGHTLDRILLKKCVHGVAGSTLFYANRDWIGFLHSAGRRHGLYG